MVISLGERAEAIRQRKVSTKVDNMLNITNEGRKLALDPRILNSMLPDYENSKVNLCVNNLFNIWETTKEQKSTQLVFCDFYSTPKS